MRFTLVDNRFFSLHNLWVTILFLSFSYDKSILDITSVDRFNPRIIDIAFILAIIWYLKEKIFYKIFNPVYIAYKKLIYVFVFACLASILIYDFPSIISAYSLYFLLKYLKEILICFFFLQILKKYNFDYIALINLLLLGAFFVVCYSFLESVNLQDQVIVNADKFIYKSVNTVWGPFTASYFQLANYSPVIGFLLFNFGLNSNIKRRHLYTVVGILLISLSFFTGSRTSLGFLFCMIIISSFYDYKFRRFLIGFLSLCIIYFVFMPTAIDLFFSSNTINRLFLMQDIYFERNSIFSRIFIFNTWLNEYSNYAYNGIFMPFSGAGFYVAPIDNFYRIGYGWHNSLIFVFEQAGILGLIYFINFISKTNKSLIIHKDLVKNHNMYVFIFSIKVIFVSMIILSLTGAHTFFLGFATGNFNLLRIFLLLMASDLLIKNNYEKNSSS